MKAIPCALAIVVSMSTFGRAQAPPAGATGTWQSVGFPPVTLVLKAEGSAVSGTLGAGATGTEITGGKVDGNLVTFNVQIPGGRTVIFSGTLKDDEIAFTREVRVPPGAEPGGGGILGQGGPAEFTVQRVIEANNWTGTIRNAPTPRNPDVNPFPRAVTLGSKKVPAPHWRWRGGEKQIDVRTFTFPMGTFDVNVFELEGDRLSFTITRGAADTKCDLTRQEAVFRGRCTLGGGNNAWLIDLTPPPDDKGPAQPASGTAVR